MPNYASATNFDELASYIKEKCDAMRPLTSQWADIARLAIQGLPHDVQLLSELQTGINDIRADLRRAVLAASEHFSDEQLAILQKQARISKYGWRSLKKNSLVTIKNGFTLVIY